MMTLPPETPVNPIPVLVGFLIGAVRVLVKKCEIPQFGLVICTVIRTRGRAPHEQRHQRRGDHQNDYRHGRVTSCRQYSTDC